MLKNLKTLLKNGQITALAYHFAEYINTKQADDDVAFAAALLSDQNSQGHVCISLDDYAGELLYQSEDFEGIQAPTLRNWIDSLKRHPWVSEQFPSPLVLEDNNLYLGKYWHFESQLAQSINDKLSQPATTDLETLKYNLKQLFPESNNTNTDWQKVAAATALLNRFVVISGGPGTGKTSTVIRILALLLAQKPKMTIELVAPTGKAAARLAESIRQGKLSERQSAITDNEKAAIPETAKTIHRLLKYAPNRGFQHNANRPLLVDTLVVDEASMVDLSLMARLMTAIPSSTNVILLGDKDQLSSVEAGSVLGDITGHGQTINYSEAFIQRLESLNVINAGQITNTQPSPPAISQSIALLHKSYRFDDESGIGTAAKLINQQKGKDALNRVLYHDDYSDTDWISHKQQSLAPECLQWALRHYQPYFKQKNVADALTLFEQTRILTAIRKGDFGAEAINLKITQAIKQSKRFTLEDEFHGKPIMITQNDYEMDLFNGDIGLLWQDKESDMLKANFRSLDGQIRSIPARQLPKHETAFVMTIHKSQGSEFDKLLLILPNETNPVMTKELIYTGITRAKKSVLVAGTKRVFIEACKKTVKRSSGLGEKLGWTT